MKILVLLTLCAYLQAQTCQPKLLESFDLDGATQVVPYGNIICNTVPANRNCCSYLNQLKIYQSWAVHKERKKILKFYNQFHKTFENIFDTFKKIEEQSLTIMSHTNSNQAGSNCYKISSAINGFKASTMKDMVLGLATKSFQFLYHARKGFYCSLCDAQEHKYYDKNA